MAGHGSFSFVLMIAFMMGSDPARGGHAGLATPRALEGPLPRAQEGPSLGPRRGPFPGPYWGPGALRGP